MIEPEATPPCIWESKSCEGPIEQYRMQVGDGELTEPYMCTFHAQYWPKVGETKEETEKRTKRARMRMSSPDRARAAAIRRAASRQRGQQRQRTHDIEGKGI